MKFTADSTARSPASASTRRRRTPARTSAACGRAGGTKLAQATFTDETASGWQTVTFSSPSRSPPARPTSRPTSRPTATTRSTRRRSRPAVDNPPLNALANGDQPQRRLRLQVRERRSRPDSWNASNYCVDVLFAPAPAPGTPDRRDGDRRASVGDGLVDGAGERRPGHLLHGHAVHRRDGADAEDDDRHAADDRTTISGLTGGTAYTFKVRAANLAGSGPASAASNSVTPHEPDRAGRADRRRGARPTSQAAIVSWTAPASDGGSAITGYTVTPYIGATAQTATQAGASATSRPRHRPRPTAPRTRSRSRRPTRSAPARRRPPPPRSRRGISLFELQRPPRPTAATPARSTSA